MEKKEKVLIIKTGYSEFLESEKNSRKISYGDVLRVTPLLHLYKNDHITWVTDRKAFPLLERNPYIDRLLDYDLTTTLQLESEEFDIIINLEKVPGICALSDKIRARKARYGFTFNTQTGRAEALDKAIEALAISSNPELKKANNKVYMEHLFEMVGREWKKEELILGYQPKSEEIYDIGLNVYVGEKWPTKLWSKGYWDKLEEILKENGFKVSRQDKQGPEVLENLYGYIDWINSCKLIISGDSLGMHLGIALRKKVLGLFGPTPHKEVYFHGRGKAILPELPPNCMPCFKSVCERGRNCMEDISVEGVYEEAKLLLKNLGLEKINNETSKTLIDNHKLIYHPERVKEWKEREDCYPLYVEVGLTNVCNHKCLFCALDFLENGTEFIDKEIMLRTLNEMSKKGVKSIMFAGEGESILHKDVGLFCQEAKRLGLDISITTNGVPLTKEKMEQCLPNLSWIRFSVDSGSPENYALVHGTNSEDFYKVIENIKQCVEFKKENNLDVTIGVQFLMIPQNKGEAVKLAKMLKEIGVDNFQIKPYSKHPSSMNDLIIDSEEYNCIEKELNQFSSDKFKILFRGATAERIEEGLAYPECYGLPFFALIDAKGNVIPCNLFYGKSEFTYGNIYQNNFYEIWEGEKRKEVLSKLKICGVENCRHGCRLEVINRYLHRIKNPLGHDNFV